MIKYCAISINEDIPKPMIADLFQVAFRNNNAGNSPMGINIAKYPKKLIRVTKRTMDAQSIYEALNEQIHNLHKN